MIMMAAAEGAERLRGGLQSGLRVLREQHRGWRDTLASCLPLLRALGNVGRQAEAARRVSFGETPLRAFVRLPERLRLKQRAAMEVLLAKLRREKLPALREARDAVGACLAPLLVLGGLGQDPDPQPRVPSPAWADLVAGLQDAEALFHAVLGSAAAAALAQLPGRGGGAGGPPGLGADNAARAAWRSRGRNVVESRLLPGGRMRSAKQLVCSPPGKDSSGSPAIRRPLDLESALG